MAHWASSTHIVDSGSFEHLDLTGTDTTCQDLTTLSTLPSLRCIQGSAPAQAPKHLPDRFGLAPRLDDCS